VEVRITMSFENILIITGRFERMVLTLLLLLCTHLLIVAKNLLYRSVWVFLFGMIGNLLCV